MRSTIRSTAISPEPEPALAHGAERTLISAALFPVAVRLLRGQSCAEAGLARALCPLLGASSAAVYQRASCGESWRLISVSGGGDAPTHQYPTNGPDVLPVARFEMVEHPDRCLAIAWSGAAGRSARAVIGVLHELLGARQQALDSHQQAVVRERISISDELHDSLAQSLSYLKIQVLRLQRTLDGRLPDGQWRDALDEIRDQSALCYRQLRELMSTFRLTLDGRSLEQAVGQSLDEFARRSPLVFHTDIRFQDCPLSAEEELQVLQVLRESVANVVRHAQASAVSVALHASADRVSLSVCDDGCGIADSSRGDHYGLVIMQARAARLGAQLSIDSRLGEGTTIELVFVPARRRHASPAGGGP